MKARLQRLQGKDLPPAFVKCCAEGAIKARHRVETQYHSNSKNGYCQSE